MKKSFVAATVAVLALVTTAVHADENRVARGTISNPGCKQKSDPIVVPPGMIAYAFERGALRGGTECVSGKYIDSAGFTIAYDNPSNMKVQDVYGYRERNNTLYEDSFGKSVPGDGRTPAVLNALVLGQGKYFIFVGGGDGAVAEIRYKLKAGQGSGPLSGGIGGLGAQLRSGQISR